MEIVLIKAKPSDDLKKYAIVMDGRYIDLGVDNEEYVAIEGKPGDGISHFISYTLFGSAGDTLDLSVTHTGRELVKLEGIKIFPGTQYAAGEQDFSL
jgi:hypothetical protein